MTEQKPHLDYSKLGDTGEDNTTSISPVSDGEGATQSVFRRPSENLRTRSEDNRQGFEDLFYYRDALPTLFSADTVRWAGTVLDGGTGRVFNTGDLILRPFLVPAADTKGSLAIGTPASNEITYTVDSSAYSTDGMNSVAVEHRDIGASAAVLSAAISDGPVKRIVVFFDSADATQDALAAQTAVVAAVAADSDLVGKLNVSIDAAASVVIDAAAEDFIGGTYEAEEHRIPAGTISSFTNANPLAAGDTLAIFYKYLVDPGVGAPDDPKGGVAGGRRESSQSRASSTIPSASLFITSVNPEKIPGAFPICTVQGNTASPGTILRFIDGTILAKDQNTFLGSANSGNVQYDGGSDWADSTTNPATDVGTQLDKIIDDLTSVVGQGGAGKINKLASADWANADPNPGGTLHQRVDQIIADLADVTSGGGGDGVGRIGMEASAGTPVAFAQGTLRANLLTLLTELNRRGILDAPNTWVDANDFDEGLTATKTAAVGDATDVIEVTGQQGTTAVRGAAVMANGATENGGGFGGTGFSGVGGDGLAATGGRGARFVGGPGTVASGPALFLSASNDGPAIIFDNHSAINGTVTDRMLSWLNGTLHTGFGLDGGTPTMGSAMPLAKIRGFVDDGVVTITDSYNITSAVVNGDDEILVTLDGTMPSTIGNEYTVLLTDIRAASQAFAGYSGSLGAEMRRHLHVTQQGDTFFRLKWANPNGATSSASFDLESGGSQTQIDVGFAAVIFSGS